MRCFLAASMSLNAPARVATALNGTVRKSEMYFYCDLCQSLNLLFFTNLSCNEWKSEAKLNTHSSVESVGGFIPKIHVYPNINKQIEVCPLAVRLNKGLLISLAVSERKVRALCAASE